MEEEEEEEDKSHTASSGNIVSPLTGVIAKARLDPPATPFKRS